MSEDEKRFPIQGNCHRKGDCQLWFCGKKGIHASYGSVPWSVAIPAMQTWHKSYGNHPTLEASMKRMAERGGLDHHEMDVYTGSHDWYQYFVENKG